MTRMDAYATALELSCIIDEIVAVIEKQFGLYDVAIFSEDISNPVCRIHGGEEVPF